MRKKLELSKDLGRLTPCAARLLELLVEQVPELKYTSKIRMEGLRDGQKHELDLLASSPSEQIMLEIESNADAVEVRFFEKNKSGVASAIFFMHPLNFHRTAEAVVEFIDKIASGRVIVAREKKRIIPFIGPKRLKFYDVGEIVGARAAAIEKVFAWERLHL